MTYRNSVQSISEVERAPAGDEREEHQIGDDVVSKELRVLLAVELSAHRPARDDVALHGSRVELPTNSPSQPRSGQGEDVGPHKFLA